MAFHEVFRSISCAFITLFALYNVITINDHNYDLKYKNFRIEMLIRIMLMYTMIDLIYMKTTQNKRIELKFHHYFVIVISLISLLTGMLCIHLNIAYIAEAVSIFNFSRYVYQFDETVDLFHSIYKITILLLVRYPLWYFLFGLDYGIFTIVKLFIVIMCMLDTYWIYGNFMKILSILYKNDKKLTNKIHLLGTNLKIQLKGLL
ncbi:MAG: hypothetical protein Terrestrivirus2_138 [Terrestrivirus sp.]|uniref:TLC domain-containing protein n=1 Tax=Terrestrivirus sp. TaxID=2487775 RepID=A0A3G4ZLA3_9VIRU|nr:MAG: hypothetical protein Terrestrivirus2_138 [Terrestrivirus sp.]